MDDLALRLTLERRLRVSIMCHFIALVYSMLTLLVVFFYCVTVFDMVVLVCAYTWPVIFL
jgi:LytS/YehU family sensor histidine kinase